MNSLKKVKHDIKACPKPPCNDCRKDHHSLICLEERKEQKIHTVQDDEEDSDDDSNEENYYGDQDIFEDIMKFHFKHEDDSGDGSLEDFQDEDEYEDGQDQPEGGPEDGVFDKKGKAV